MQVTARAQLYFLVVFVCTDGGGSGPRLTVMVSYRLLCPEVGASSDDTEVIVWAKIRVSALKRRDSVSGK